jgi:hypothetical protein
MGILYLVSAGFLIFIWAWFNASDEPEVPKILIRGTIGIASLLCVKFLSQRDEQKELSQFRSTALHYGRNGFTRSTGGSGRVTF